MADVIPIVPVKSDPNKLVKDSKLFALARAEKLLELMTPNIAVQMMTESQVDTDFPRVEEDKDDTRILINYTNLRGKSSLYKITDDERLNRKFDIDHFLNGFMTQIGIDPALSDLIDSVNSTLLSALNMSLTSAMSMDPELQNDAVKQLSETVFKSLVSILLDDPLDVFVAFKEKVPEEGGDTVSIVYALWTLKVRDKDKVQDITLEQLEKLDRDLPEDLDDTSTAE